MDTKPIILSGIQPSGAMTIGNYLGALANWVKLQDAYYCYYCVADLHAITVPQAAKDLRKNTLQAAAMLLALGVDPEKSTLFIQSHVSAHAELAWILDCYTYIGEAKRMTQFKDKSEKRPEATNVGLFAYPVLMAADILLYQAELVPIGADQKQHLELARNLADRFNNQYSPTFTVPEAYMCSDKRISRVMSLCDPTKKMSKSEPAGAVFLTDTPDEIRAKFRRAVTDSLGKIAFDPENQPGVANLLSIYAAFSGNQAEAAAAEFDGCGYGDLKSRTADCVIARLEPIQKEYNRILQDKEVLARVLKTGAERAGAAARRTLSKVTRKIGLVQLADDR